MQTTERLTLWYEDINKAENDVRYDFVYVDEGSFHTYRPTSFGSLVTMFREYKD
jgi:type III restriction enzyme